MARDVKKLLKRMVFVEHAAESEDVALTQDVTRPQNEKACVHVTAKDDTVNMKSVQKLYTRRTSVENTLNFRSALNNRGSSLVRRLVIPRMTSIFQLHI